MNASDKYAEEVAAAGPDLASALFSLTAAVCNRLGPNVCPFRAALVDGKCPAKLSPCPHAIGSDKMLSQPELRERRRGRRAAIAPGGPDGE